MLYPTLLVTLVDVDHWRFMHHRRVMLPPEASRTPQSSSHRAACTRHTSTLWWTGSSPANSRQTYFLSASSATILASTSFPALGASFSAFLATPAPVADGLYAPSTSRVALEQADLYEETFEHEPPDSGRDCGEYAARAGEDVRVGTHDGPEGRPAP
jgi:hypothetical protein